MIRRSAIGVLCAAFLLAVSALAGGQDALAGEEEVVGVRGPVMTLFDEPGGAQVGEVSRRQGRDLRKDPLKVVADRGDWIEVNTAGSGFSDRNTVWVRSREAQLSQNRPKLTCGSKLGGSQAGASRGIGDDC